jgi:hypothetical protein
MPKLKSRAIAHSPKQYCFKIYAEDETMDPEVMKRITQKALSMM